MSNKWPFAIGSVTALILALCIGQAQTPGTRTQRPAEPGHMRD
jgi:hypothetical protein